MTARARLPIGPMLALRARRLPRLATCRQAQARRVINAAGLTVSPGFIDTHAHSDGILLIDPQHADGLRQGITTEILGQDGLSYAPLSPENYRMNRRYLAGILGEPPEDLDMSSVASFRSHYHKKTAINTAYCIPHGAIRLETVGFYDKPLVGDALEKGKQLIREGMEQGAVGLATGMSYFPNAWSDTDELVELCKVVAEYGGVYVTHLRDVNTERGFGGGDVPEALEIGRRSSVKVHFSHYRTHPESAGKVAERVELIDKAKAEGVDCTLELYPYPTGSSYPIRYLPSEVNNGGPEALMERLRDPEERQRMLEYMQERSNDLSSAVFTYLPKNSHLEGMSLRDIAAERGVSMEEAMMEMLVDEELQVGYRGRSAGQREGLAAGQPRLRGTALEAGLYGGQRLDTCGQHAAPKGLWLLPALSWTAATQFWNAHARRDGAAYDRQCGTTVWADRTWAHRAGRIRGYSGVR